MLGKIINGILQTKEAVMLIDGKRVSNPTDEQLIADGYKDVIYTERPEGNYNQKYIVTDVITVEWEEIITNTIE
jgi:hypothetical protein